MIKCDGNHFEDGFTAGYSLECIYKGNSYIDESTVKDSGSQKREDVNTFQQSERKGWHTNLSEQEGATG